jgi:hypothetical protein
VWSLIPAYALALTPPGSSVQRSQPRRAHLRRLSRRGRGIRHERSIRRGRPIRHETGGLKQRLSRRARGHAFQRPRRLGHVVGCYHARIAQAAEALQRRRKVTPRFVRRFQQREHVRFMGRFDRTQQVNDGQCRLVLRQSLCTVLPV